MKGFLVTGFRERRDSEATGFAATVFYFIKIYFTLQFSRKNSNMYQNKVFVKIEFLDF